MRSLHRLPLLMAGLLLLLAACGNGEAGQSTQPATETTAAAGQTLEGQPRRLIEARGIEIPEGLSMTIEFQSGRVSGQSSCNRFSGSYESEGESLTISELVLTKKACPERVTQIETALVRALRRVAGYSFDGDRLLLHNAQNRPALTYRPFGATDVQGRWAVTGLLSRNQEAFATPIEGTNLTANFRQGGEMQGNGGCNTFGGGYEVEGNTITIGELAATQKACENPVMRQEGTYMQALNQAVTFEVNGQNLVFFNGEDKRLVSFRPAG